MTGCFTGVIIGAVIVAFSGYIVARVEAKRTRNVYLCDPNDGCPKVERYEE
jgi:gas vesicle protein